MRLRVQEKSYTDRITVALRDRWRLLPGRLKRFQDAERGGCLHLTAVDRNSTVLRCGQRQHRKRYKITLKAKDNSQSSEQVKTLLKKNINPAGIKVGIKAFRSLHDGRIRLEAGSEDEINALSSHITDKCGQHLEVTKHTCRKPKRIIYNVSEDLDLENASAVIIDQNPELKL
ncbi:hypothetical protein C0J52_21341 [Blattella germanica]|nr:hypothetical protein C0J52_21341 [Blattella germanica]